MPTNNDMGAEMGNLLDTHYDTILGDRVDDSPRQQSPVSPREPFTNFVLALGVVAALLVFFFSGAFSLDNLWEAFK